jgi:hypothetical protein
MKRCIRACEPKIIKELGQASYFVLASIVARYIPITIVKMSYVLADRIGSLDCLKLVVSYGAGKLDLM